MLAAVLLATAAAAAGAAYLPPDAFGVWETDRGLLTVHGEGIAIAPDERDVARNPLECVIVQQNPGVYQYAVTCDDGESYTLTMRDTGGKGAIEDVTLEFDGLIYTKVPER